VIKILPVQYPGQPLARRLVASLNLKYTPKRACITRKSMAYNYYIRLQLTRGKWRDILIALSILSYFIIFALLAALAYRDLKEYILPDYLNAALGLSFLAFHISKHTSSALNG
jgi:hypothetical protein